MCIDLVSFFNSWDDGCFYFVSDTMNASARASLGEKRGSKTRLLFIDYHATAARKYDHDYHD